MKPLLFLDVDGVLNCEDEEHHEILLDGERVFVSVGIEQRVAKLIEVFDPVWATAWQGTAHRVWSKILNLDPMPWPFVSYNRWKIVEIIKMAEGRPFVWIDDDAMWELNDLGWTIDMVPGKVIIPEPLNGLQDHHVREAIDFALEQEKQKSWGPFGPRSFCCTHQQTIHCEICGF